MTANKLRAAGITAGAILVGIALLAIERQGGIGPAASNDAAPAAGSVAAGAPAVPGKPGAPRKLGDKPYWRALTPDQQRALLPLQGEWDAMDGVRKQKWLQLARRFGSMKPEEQQRLHERMREWTRLTPAQRELARETYSRTRKIAPEQKTATWESYQQLPDDQKRKLAASAARKPPVVPAQAGTRAGMPLGQGSAACPAGSVKNSISATPPCVPAPASAPAGTVPATPPATAPANPAPPAQQDKPEPANWGITPNNA